MIFLHHNAISTALSEWNRKNYMLLSFQEGVKSWILNVMDNISRYTCTQMSHIADYLSLLVTW